MDTLTFYLISFFRFIESMSMYDSSAYFDGPYRPINFRYIPTLKRSTLDCSSSIHVNKGVLGGSLLPWFKLPEIDKIILDRKNEE